MFGQLLELGGSVYALAPGSRGGGDNAGNFAKQRYDITASASGGGSLACEVLPRFVFQTR